VTSPSQRPLPDNTPHSHETDIHALGEFFFCLSGVFPLSSIFVLFKSFRPSCHFTFHITVLSTNTTQTSMPPVRFFFEPTIPVSERPKTHALDRTATGIGTAHPYREKIKSGKKRGSIINIKVEEQIRLDASLYHICVCAELHAVIANLRQCIHNMLAVYIL
jgi:hypothetical protein